jgi:hypothetical protein
VVVGFDGGGSNSDAKEEFVMEQLGAVAIVAAVVMSAAALLVAIGTAARVQQLTDRNLVPSGLQKGSPIPRAELEKMISGNALDALVSGPSLVVFVSARCKPCRELVALLSEGDLGLSNSTMLMVDTSGNESADLRELGKFPSTWIVDSDRGLREAFKTNGTPTTYVLSGGIVRQQVVGPNLEAIVAALSAARDGTLSGSPPGVVDGFTPATAKPLSR